MPSTDAHPEPQGHTNQPGSVTELAASAVEWLTIGQAAKHLHMSISSMRRYDKAGTIPATRTPGGQRRWLRSDLDAWLARPDRAA